MSYDEPLEVLVGWLLEQRHMTLALAESCTGGLASHRITNVPGSSAYYLGAVVSYANQIKTSLLAVQPSTLARHGAVSQETALEMAQNVRRLFGADVSLSVTGIAGPSGGTPEKPVGLVYVGLATLESVRVERHEFAEDRGGCDSRLGNKTRFAEAALRLLYRHLKALV
jgi:nicotinamide-nucleotide amidase